MNTLFKPARVLTGNPLLTSMLFMTRQPKVSCNLISMYNAVMGMNSRFAFSTV